MVPAEAAELKVMEMGAETLAESVNTQVWPAVTER